MCFLSRSGVVARDVVFFFFQAEDGIRDLVRSRGLGDVYKRQDDVSLTHLGGQVASPGMAQRDCCILALAGKDQPQGAPDRQATTDDADLRARDRHSEATQQLNDPHGRARQRCRTAPVSYTHLTLPTSDLV